MDFDVKLAAALPEMQSLAQSLMKDFVVVTRSGGDPVEDEWGQIIEPDPIVVYEGRAKFQHSDPYPTTPDVAEARWTTGVRQVHFPVGTPLIRSDDMVECIESRNPRLPGLQVRLRLDGDKTWNTAVRYQVIEVVSREG